MPELIDTHVHLDDPRLAENLAEVQAYSKKVGVTRMINIGHNMESSRASVKLAEDWDNVWAAVGIHPHSAKDVDDQDFAELELLAAEPKVVAIGEIGLDYHYDYSPRPIQKEVFCRQLEMAHKLKKPIVIHQREAVQDTMEILESFTPITHGGVMHCFSGSVEVMRQCLELNLHIGLGGPVTFTNARKVKEVAAVVPLSRLLLETDCPYLSPHPHRGKVNQPGYLPLVAAEIAQIKDIALEDLISACSANAISVFGLPE